MDKRRVEALRKQPRNGQRPRIPCRMAGKNLLRKTERAEFFRDGGGSVFADKKDVALRCGVLDANRLPFLL
jgi:hypothetical protein